MPGCSYSGIANSFRTKKTHAFAGKIPDYLDGIQNCYILEVSIIIVDEYLI